MLSNRNKLNFDSNEEKVHLIPSQKNSHKNQFEQIDVDHGYADTFIQGYGELSNGPPKSRNIFPNSSDKNSNLGINNQSQHHELITITNRNERNRTLGSGPSTSQFVLYDIKPGDTLTNLALRYRCSVAKIKELNKIGNEQEFYALNQIKLPQGSLGLLSDILEQERELEQKTQHLAQNFSSNSSNFELYEIPQWSVTSVTHSQPQPSLTSSQFMLTPGSANRHISHKSPEDVPISQKSLDLQFSQAHLSKQDTDNLQNSVSQINYNINKQDVSTLRLPSLKLSSLDLSDPDEELDVNGHSKTRVDAIFSNLDQQIEQAKIVTAELYERRSSEFAGVNASTILGLNDEENYNLLAGKKVRNMYEEIKDNSPFGIDYRFLLIFVFLVCLMVPLMYVVYIEESGQPNL